MILTLNTKQNMLFHPPLVNYDFKLTIGQNYDVEMGFYQSGFFKNDFGGISPAQFMQHTIEKVGIDAIMDTMTGMYMANSRYSINRPIKKGVTNMFNRHLLVYQGGHLNPRCQQRKLYCGKVPL